MKPVDACMFCTGKAVPRGAKCRYCGRAGEKLAHMCHADGCNVVVSPRMLMCRPHWRMVPVTIQRKVWAAYVPGQEITKTPSAEYVDVMREAIKAVADLERPS